MRNAPNPQHWTVLSMALVWALVAVPAFGQAGRGQVNEGNRLFKEGKYAEALERYQRALRENPDSPIVQHNLGDAQFKNQDFEKAAGSFSKALQSDQTGLQSRSFYNLGNALYRQGKLEEALEAYQRALRVDPNDREAKYNLEFVREKLKDRSQQKKDQQNKDEQKADQQREQDKKRQEGNSKAQEEDKKADQQPGEREPANPQDAQPLKMTRQQAERLLQALEANQKNLRKKELQTKTRVRIKKDW